MSHLLFLVLLMVSGGLAACDKNFPVQKQHAANDPVLAVVGNDAITLSAVDNELMTLDMQNRGNIAPALQKQALDALVDRNIVAHEASRRNIDHDPAVVAAIDRSREKILVQAYLQQMTAAIPKPTQTQIDTYYKEHRRIFAERKLFKADELMVDTDNARQAVRAMSNAGTPMRQILLWLDEHNLSYTLQQDLITSDKLPKGLADAASRLADGKPFIVEDDLRFQIWSLRLMGQRPLDESAVKDEIEKAIIEQQTHRQLAATIASLRAREKVSYSNSVDGGWNIDSIAAGEVPLLEHSSPHALAAQGVRK